MSPSAALMNAVSFSSITIWFTTDDATGLEPFSPYPPRYSSCLQPNRWMPRQLSIWQVARLPWRYPLHPLSTSNNSSRRSAAVYSEIFTGRKITRGIRSESMMTRGEGCEGRGSGHLGCFKEWRALNRQGLCHTEDERELVKLLMEFITMWTKLKT